MKIAVCFTGRVKTYEHSLPWFQAIIDDTHTDIFCSINGECDDYHETFMSLFKVKKSYYGKYILPYDEEIFYHNRRPESNIYNVHSMLYNKKKCLELVKSYEREHNIKYDIVVFFRADILAEESYPLIVPENDNSIYIPAGFDWGGVNDQIAHGTMAAMEKYVELYDRARVYCLQEGCIFHPETLLAHHIRRNEINLRRFNFLYRLNHNRV